MAPRNCRNATVAPGDHCSFFVSLDYFVSVLLSFGVLGLVPSVTSQEFGWEERLRSDLAYSVSSGT